MKSLPGQSRHTFNAMATLQVQTLTLNRRAPAISTMRGTADDD